MGIRPQKTNFQLKIVENVERLNIWAYNPWRKYSLAIILLLFGYFVGSSLGMISAVFNFMDPVGAFISVFIIEILVKLRRGLRLSKFKEVLVLLIDCLRIGLYYGFFTEAIKLL